MKRTEVWLKWITIIATLGGLLWTVTSSLQNRAIEARRPFLSLQLALYKEVTKTTAILATSTDEAELSSAEKRFWQLYWGELAMVENGGMRAASGGVEGAMVRFGAQLQSKPPDRGELQKLSLELSHMCRDSLAGSWGINDWKTPVYEAPK